MFADSAGVHRSDDGVTWATWAGLGEDTPRALTAIEGHLFLVTRTGAVWRSDDGGEGWVVQPGRVPSPVFVMGRMPGADGVEVWLGALDGVYTLVDPLGAATVERFAPYQRVDDRSPFLACDRCGPRVDHYAAGMSSVTALETGVASVQLRGEAVRVIGTATSTARAEVWIDGALAARVGSVSHPDPAVLAEVGGLRDGWHDVEVRGTAAGIGIDAVEASGEGGREGGGCGGGSVAGIGVMVLGLRRRRRDGRTAGGIATPSPSWEA